MAGAVEQHIRAWLEQFVVGLNLCPFALPVMAADTLRIAVCEAAEPTALRRAFLTELDRLQSHSEQEIATTLLAFPRALTDFDDYLQFLYEAGDLLSGSGLEGLVQLASFHPEYRFEGEDEDAPGNYSNRAPYPIIHLLRENMLTRVLEDYADPAQIPVRNVATLDAIGAARLQRRWRQLFQAPSS